MEPDLQDREAPPDVPERPEPPKVRWIPTPQAPPAPTATAPEPASDELLYRAARQAELNGENARAIGIYRELLHRHESHVAARANLALLLGRTGQPDAALVEFATCLSHDPDNTEVLVYRAALLATETRYAEAEGDLHTVLRVDPGNVEAHYHLGLVLSRKGRWADA
ncbi:MAG: tetratricopeptide repeat protein, partial [Gemmatimonadota bacterium]|nr:tetratricopeptide repeat protein [Gemmatimonadota bacterium]